MRVLLGLLNRRRLGRVQRLERRKTPGVLRIIIGGLRRIGRSRVLRVLRRVAESGSRVGEKPRYHFRGQLSLQGGGLELRQKRR